MAKILILLGFLGCLLLPIASWGQAPDRVTIDILPPPKAEWGITPFRLESNVESNARLGSGKILAGLYYVQPLRHSRWSSVSEVEFARNTLLIQCRNCSDALEGTTTMREWAVETGLRYDFAHARLWKLRPYAQALIGYRNLVNYGMLGGGFTGAGLLVNAHSSSFSTGFDVGVCVLTGSVMNINLSAGAKFAKTSSHSAVNKFQLASVSILQTQVGFRF